MLFIFADSLGPWSLAYLGETVPSRASQFVEAVNNSPVRNLTGTD
jgi:hypothetical protein